MARQSRGVQLSFCESYIAKSDDGFTHLNVFRLLGIANMHAEGVAVLRDSRWIGKQVNFCGWKQVENDMLIILQIFVGYMQCFSRTEKTYLRMLRATVIESGQHIASSLISGVMWTQLYRRLWHYKLYDLVGQF